MEETGKEVTGCGVHIVDTEPESEAEEVGLRTGDIILRVDGLAVQSPDEVIKAIQKTKEQFVILKIERYIPKNRKGSVVGLFKTKYSSSCFIQALLSVTRCD